MDHSLMLSAEEIFDEAMGNPDGSDTAPKSCDTADTRHLFGVSGHHDPGGGHNNVPGPDRRSSQRIRHHQRNPQALAFLYTPHHADHHRSITGDRHRSSF